MKDIINRFKQQKNISLFKNSFYYGAGQLVQKFLSLILLPIYTRFLSPEDYGIIALMSVFTMITATITMSGLTNGISRYYFYTKQDNSTKDEVVLTPLLFILVFTALIVGIVCAFSSNLSNFFFDSTNYTYIIQLAVSTIFFSNIFSVCHSVLIFEEKVWTVNLLTITNVLIGAFLGITLVIYLDRGVNGIFEAAFFTAILTSILISYIVLRKLKWIFNGGLLLKQLKFSLPLMLAVFAFFFIDSSDIYVLKLFLPLSEVGLYNIGYQFGMLIVLFVGGFSAAWPPFYHKNNSDGQGQSFCGDVLTVYLVITIPCVVIISHIGPIAIQLLTPVSYHESYTVIPFVALAYMLKGPYIIFLMGLLVKNKTSWQLYLEILAAAINIILNFTLIPIIGKEAAAMTTLLSYTVMVVGSYIMVNIVNPLPNFRIFKPTLYFLIGILFSVLSLYFYRYNWSVYTLSPILFIIFSYVYYKNTFTEAIRKLV